MRFGFTVAMFFLGVPGCNNSKTEREDYLAQFQGAWDVAAFDESGAAKDADSVKKFGAAVNKDIFQLLETNDVGDAKVTNVIVEFAVHLDGSKTPAEVDFVVRTGDNAGQTRAGIYAFEDGKLKLCLAEIGKDRPTEFIAKADSGTTLLVLRKRT